MLEPLEYACDIMEKIIEKLEAHSDALQELGVVLEAAGMQIVLVSWIVWWTSWHRCSDLSVLWGRIQSVLSSRKRCISNETFIFMKLYAPDLNCT